MNAKKTLRMLSALLAAVILCASFAFSASAAVMQLFDVTAASLAERIGDSAVSEGENTVKFTGETNIDYDIFIADGEDIVFDLNGQRVVFDNTFIAGNGKLTIKDSVGTGRLYTVGIEVSKVVIEGGNFYGPIAFNTCTVKNIEINGGNFYCNDSTTPERFDDTYGIYYGAITLFGADTYDYDMPVNIEKMKIADGVLINGGKIDGISIIGGMESGIIEIGKAEISGFDAIHSANAYIGISGEKESAEKVNLKLDGTVLKANDPSGKELNVADDSTVVWVNKPADTTKAINVSKSGVTVKAAENVFPSNTEIVITELKADDKIKKAISGQAENPLCFDISALLAGKKTQPDGEVTVIFSVPEKYNIKSTELFYISDSGKAERISTVKDEKNRTLTAKLTHFSTYVLAEKTVLTPKTGDGSCALTAGLLVLISAGVMLISGKKYYKAKH